MECLRDKNLEACTCSHESCKRRGLCCQCIRHHLKTRQLPACCFGAEADKGDDRSFSHFARLVADDLI